MTFITEAEIAAAARKLHLDITDINSVMTLTSHFMITEGFYLLSNKLVVKRCLAGEIKTFLGQVQGIKVGK